MKEHASLPENPENLRGDGVTAVGLLEGDLTFEDNKPFLTTSSRNRIKIVLAYFSLNTLTNP